LALPGVWDGTVGPVLGIKARIDPRAIPLYEAAAADMWVDRRENYGTALQKLEQALDIDPLYPQAIALAVQAHVFLGQDIQEEGKHLRSRAERLLEQISALQKQQPPPQDLEGQIAPLRSELTALDKEASRLFQAGSEEFAKA